MGNSRFVALIGTGVIKIMCLREQTKPHYVAVTRESTTQGLKQRWMIIDLIR